LVGQVSQGDVLEGAHRSEHRSTNPRSISSVKVSVNTDVSILSFDKVSKLVVKALSEALHHGGASSQHDVVV
jgi:hypothetical protein